MTANCEQFCTKDECGELGLRLSIAEAKISDLSNFIAQLQATIEALQTHVDLLEASFEAHTQQAIPEAHDFEFDFDTSGFCTVDECGSLRTDLNLLEASFESHTQQAIPEAHDYGGNFPDIWIPFVKDLVDLELKIKLKPEIELYINSAQFCTVEECGSLRIDLNLLEASFESHTQQAIPEAHDFEFKSLCDDSSLKINGSYFDGNLNITVAHCGDSDSVNIPIQIDTTDIIDTMDCENKIENCCNEILDKLTYVVTEIEDSENNLKNQIDNLRNLISQDLQTIEDYVTVDISGTIKSAFSCEFPINEETGEEETTYAQSNTEDFNVGGSGLKGLEQYLNIINTNLAAIHQDVCKAIQPFSNISLKDLYENCTSNLNQIIKPEDYPDSIVGREQYIQDVRNYLFDYLGDTKYFDKFTTGASTIAAPSYLITELKSDFALIQAKLNNRLLCEIKEAESQDVVAIVASEKDLHRVKTKVLILHFVLLDVYPKRSASDSFWQIQIPAAKDSYDWLEDFDGLRRTHGNQYAELQFNENYVPVSGWFENENAANTFFDAVLELTNATEKNRVFPKHKTPQINIAVATTRPYRAFIKSINNQGRPVCHAKYVPVINE